MHETAYKLAPSAWIGRRGARKFICAKVAKMEGNPNFDEQVSAMKAKLSDDYKHRTDTLKNLDLFVLDNSLRETTVGQLRGHTLENKRTIFNQVSELVCGL